ncbi:MAG: hypothetical protein SWY16_13905 [Cyanobacteriota bacterium]|nr:hypothetical protein [Cyanobacteriota bacterium]
MLPECAIEDVGKLRAIAESQGEWQPRVCLQRKRFGNRTPARSPKS